MFSAGANAVDANTRMARIGNDAACAASDVRGAEADEGEDPREGEARTAAAGAIEARNGERGRRGCGSRRGSRRPIIISTTPKLRTRSASAAPGEHRRSGHRQRTEPLDEALVQVLGEADAGVHGAEGDGLHEHARHEEVDVRESPGTSIDAAEHVAERQHEDDRLDRARTRSPRGVRLMPLRLRQVIVRASATAQPSLERRSTVGAAAGAVMAAISRPPPARRCRRPRRDGR